MPNGPATGPAAPLPGWLGPVVQLTTQVGIPTVPLDRPGGGTESPP
jgi:hypothetical protein